MKRAAIAFALALTLTASLTACNTDRDAGSTKSGSNGAGSVSAGQVARRYNTQMNQGRNYFYDGHYTAGPNGQIYGSYNPTGRALTQDARDLTRDGQNALTNAGRDLGRAAQDVGRGVTNAARDVGRGVTDAARDITGGAINP